MNHSSSSLSLGSVIVSKKKAKSPGLTEVTFSGYHQSEKVTLTDKQLRELAKFISD